MENNLEKLQKTLKEIQNLKEKNGQPSGILGRLMHSIREENGYTNEELALELGISVEELNKIFYNSRWLNKTQEAEFCKKFKIDRSSVEAYKQIQQRQTEHLFFSIVD